MTEQASSSPKGSVRVSQVSVPEANARVYEAGLAVHTAPSIQIGQAALMAVAFGVSAVAGLTLLGAAAIGQSITRDLSFDIIFGLAALSIGSCGCYLSSKSYAAMRRAVASMSDD